MEAFKGRSGPNSDNPRAGSLSGHVVLKLPATLGIYIQFLMMLPIAIYFTNHT